MRAVQLSISEDSSYFATPEYGSVSGRRLCSERPSRAVGAPESLRLSLAQRHRHTTAFELSARHPHQFAGDTISPAEKSEFTHRHSNAAKP